MKRIEQHPTFGEGLVASSFEVEVPDRHRSRSVQSCLATTRAVKGGDEVARGPDVDDLHLITECT